MSFASCADAWHSSQRACRDASDVEACLRDRGCRREPSDRPNEVQCTVDGYSDAFYATVDGGGGPQVVHGWRIAGGPTRTRADP